MNRKLLYFILLIISILLISGCDIKEKGGIENKITEGLKITQIVLPSQYLTMLNDDKTVDIKNTSYDSNKIEIAFNQDIVDDDYILGYFTHGNYFAIKNEYDENNQVYFKYHIIKNRLIITPIKGYFFNITFDSLYIPNTIKSIDNNLLENEKVFVFKTNDSLKLNYNKNSEFNLDESRSIYSFSFKKHKNDGVNLAYVNNGESFMLSKNEDTASTLKVYRGENVVILDEVDNYYLVNIYFDKLDTIDTFDKDFEVIQEKDFNIVKGYIEKNNITKIPEPFNENVTYEIITYIGDEYRLDSYIIFCINNPMFGGQSFNITDNIRNLEEIDLYTLECSTLNNWLIGYNYVFPEDYLISELDESGNFISRLDKASHLPEINWNEKDYNSYMNSFNSYCNFMIDILKDFETAEGMQGLINDLIHELNFRITLQKLWIDWAYKNNLENDNYMFEEIFNKIDFSDEYILRIKNMFDNEEKGNEESKNYYKLSEYNAKGMLFESKMILLCNNYESSVRQYYSYLGEMINKKYFSGEVFSISTYEQMKEDAAIYYKEQERLAEISRQEEEKRIQAIIDSGSDITEVDEVFANYLNLSDEEKEKISKLFYEKSEEYTGNLIICTVIEKQCVKGKNEILLKVKISGIRNESELLKDNIYNVIYISGSPDGKEVIDVGEKITMGVLYKKSELDILYADNFMVFY